MSKDVVTFLLQREIAFLLPAKRNSALYEVRIHLTRHFFYRERLIRYGKRGGYELYSTTTGEIRVLRGDLQTFMEERFARLEREIGEIKARLAMV